MCFYIHSNHKKVKIAKQDIVCYKKLDSYMFHGRRKGVFRSPHQGCHYDFIKQTVYFVDDFGIYDDRIFQGLHSFSIERNCKGVFTDEFKCIIPKGTQYYYNPDHNEYVSLKLKFVERLTFYNEKF